MTPGEPRWLPQWLTMALLVSPFLLASCRPLEVVDNSFSGEGMFDGATGSASVPTVRSLARDVDCLEAHIERFGSVTVKQPDVWGQARLTKVRDDFETQMATELGTFKATLQGSSFASDQAYFADAMALSIAASGDQQYARPPKTVVNNTTTTSGQATATAPPSPGTPLTPTQLPSTGNLENTFGAFGSVTRNASTLPAALGFGPTGQIALEPTIYLEQKARYLNALNELRRINEGDDTADSPGYSLNLVRLPVSILPGKQTDIGYGAEITMTLTPHLSDELLPTTFRNLVLNDLVDQIGFPTTQFINNPENNVYLDLRNSSDIAAFFRFVEHFNFEYQVDGGDKTPEQDQLRRLKEFRSKQSLQGLLARAEWAWVDEYINARDSLHFDEQRLANLSKGIKDQNSELELLKIQELEAIPNRSEAEQKELDYHKNSQLQRAPTIEVLNRRLGDLANNTRTQMGSQMRHINNAIAVPATKSRRARMPFPPSQLLEVFGYDFIYSLAADSFRVFAKERIARPCPDSTQITLHLPDVQGYLQEELGAAHKMLSQPGNLDLWQFCSVELVDAVRSHKADELRRMRGEFQAAIQGKTQNANSVNTTTAALAWATIVESALLTDQLVRDMKEAAAAKGFATTEYHWQDYYYPDPSAEARQAFNNYVRIRWPIHVFALDPVQQQQNIASTFSSRREMQLALSLAFVNGQVSASNMMRFARRIEFDFATIDINGTSIGFSHGNETFGWRYYPRFQTPDIDSNARVFFRDLLVGGPTKNQLLSQRRLEPGTRECDAIVIMPSFVPYASLETSSNWFKLINPKNKDLDSQYAMKLSHQVKSVQNFASCVTDSEQYRDGDVLRLHNKIKQLETRLPMQSTMVQVPYENTLGGFAMFNTGITDLAPELTGWYGAPAINPATPTTIFLVGNHFSVRQTMVIAGGQPVTGQQLLSRQVIQVTIPAKALQVGDEFQKFIDVHLATPYGVTQHLLIPVCGTSNTAAATGATTGTAWKAPQVTLAFAYGGPGIITPPGATPKVKPPSLLLLPGEEIDPAKYDLVEISVKGDDRITPKAISLTPVKYDAKEKGYVVDGGDLAAKVLAGTANSFGPEPAFPPVAFDVDTTLKFRSTQLLGPDISKATSNKLSISWSKAADASTN